jgi:6,7-dimethyl-8-ribityllumazine synthase
MLKQTRKSAARHAGSRYAVIASKYNARFVESMLRAARTVLRRSGARTVHTVRVPGAYEIPAVAARLARRASPPFDAILCLGVILRGETEHAQLIAEAVTSALTALQVECELPIIHEVLLLENVAQAETRCLDARHNRGAEAAQTAVEMVQVLARLSAHAPLGRR